MFARLQTTNKSITQVKLKKLRKHYREPYCYPEWKPLVGKPALSLGHLRSALMTEYLCSWNLLRLILPWENRYDLTFQSSILWCFKFHIRWLKIYEVVFAIWLRFLFFFFFQSLKLLLRHRQWPWHKLWCISIINWLKSCVTLGSSAWRWPKIPLTCPSPPHFICKLTLM